MTTTRTKAAAIALAAALAAAACGGGAPDKEAVRAQIARAERTTDSIRAQRAATFDEMQEPLALYKSYCDNFPDDTLCATYLYRAAEASLYLQQGHKAISYLKQIESRYPESPSIGNTIFMIGFVYENNARDIDNARIYYERFLERFPEHPLANDTRILIKNLGKSPEELIKEFEQANAH